MRFQLLTMLFCVFIQTISYAEITIGLSSTPTRLNPLFSTDANSQNIGRLTHMSLIDFSDEMQFVCRACERFEQRFEGKKHIIEFWLKKDITFWDGGSLTAKDVEKSINYYQSENKKLKSVFRFAFNKIVDVRIKGKYQIELIYSEFSLENLGNLPLLKIIKIKDLDKLEKLQLKDIIGAGRYQFGDVKSMSVTLTSTDPDLEQLVFKTVKDETTLALKLINNEIDLALSDMSPRKLDWLKNQQRRKIKVWERQSTNYKYMGINHNNVYLSKSDVRKALSYLIPRKLILKHKLKFGASLSSGMLSKPFGGVAHITEADPYDQKMAEKLLDNLGLTINNGIRFKLNLKISNNKSTVELANVLKQYFEKAGIKINLIVSEWGTFYKAIKRGNFDLMLGQWIGFTGPDILNYVFHSKKIPPKGANRGRFQSSEVDKYLDMAMNEKNMQKRNELFIAAQKEIRQSYPYIDLWHPKVIWIGQECIEIGKLYPNASFYPLLKAKSKCR